MIKDAYGNTRFYGIYRGVVTDTNDPLQKNRVKLKVPQILADNETEWAWPAIAAGTSVLVPPAGSGVWVMFEGGDPSFPMWNGVFTEIVPLAASVTVAGTTIYGLPDGGTTGQLLAKIDDRDYNVEWINEAPAASYTSTIKHQVKLGESILKGQAVYVSSADGTNMVVSKASNATEATSSKTMGLLETGGSTNAKVNVITEGLLAGLNTSTATIGDPVWLGTSGNLIYGLSNKPVAPAHLVFIGVVTRVNSNNGEIFIRPQNGFELNEIHNVLIGTGYSSTPSDNDLLAYDSASSLWKNQTASQAGVAALSGATFTGDISSNNFVTKNYLLNGAFDIWQRGTSSTTSGAYLADRWIQFRLAGTHTSSQQTDVPTGEGFAYSHRIVSTNGTAPGIMQRVESVDASAFAGKTVTFSIWAKSTNGTGALNWDTAYPTATDNWASETVDASGTFAATMTVGSWTRYSATFTANALATRGYRVTVYRNVTTTSTTTLYTGAQLELGSVTTSFKRNSPNIQAELATCQRYYTRVTAGQAYSLFASGLFNTTTNFYMPMHLPVTMRTVPAVSYGGAFRVLTSGAGTVSTLEIYSSSTINPVSLTGTISGSTTDGQAGVLSANNDSAAYIEFDSEL